MMGIVLSQTRFIIGLKTLSKTIIWILLAIATFSLSLGVVKLASSNSTSLLVYAVPSLQRIGLRETIDPVSNIQLYAARGEYESFQINIRAAGGNLTNFNIDVSDLTSKNNQLIPKSNITLYREKYVNVIHSSPTNNRSKNPSLGTGWYADALIPFVNPQTQQKLEGNELNAVPFDLRKGENQPIWVDLFIPRDAQPGDYIGTFTVTSDQENFTGKISLKVWDFELPLKPSLHSSFLVWEENSKSAWIEILKHKIMPVGKIQLSDERELIDQWGVTSVRLPFWSGADYHNCQMKPAPSVDEIKNAAAKHQPDLFLYVYPVDEIDGCKNLKQPMRQWARNIKKAGVANLAVMTPVPELYDQNFFAGKPGVDIWVVSPRMYDAATDKISDAKENGGEIWFYTALVPDNYSPKWQIDFAPINYRIAHGFINQSLGLTGVLYWRIDLWTDDPWNDVETDVRGNLFYPGEGMLVYPGKQVGVDGVVPSMRLKWIRDGVEDYEYIEILKGLGLEDWALEVSRSVGSSWREWTKNPQELEPAREKLGKAIEKKLLQLKANS